MGADVFMAFYGLEFPVPDGETLNEIVEENDERIVRARKQGLDWWLGRLTDGAPFHLLIGKKIGLFGVENSYGMEMSDAEVDGIRERTRQRLVAAGFEELPRLILKYESDY
jgi:hypothetical protein